MKIKYGYFRHRFDARNDPKLQQLADQVGMIGLAYFWALIEIYGEAYSKKEGDEVVIHIRTIASAWRLRINYAENMLSKLSALSLVRFSNNQGMISLDIPSMLKYYGSYKKTDDQKEPNKREIKGKEIKEEDVKVDTQPHWLLVLWNSKINKNISQVGLKPSRQRLDAIKRRLKDFPTEQEWDAMIAKINASAFCQGANDRQWRADLPWLLKSKENCDKLIEGKYDNKKSNNQPVKPVMTNDVYEELRKMKI